MTHEKALQCLLSVVHNDPGHTHLPVTPDLTPHIQVATTKDKVLLQHFFSLFFSPPQPPPLSTSLSLYHSSAGCTSCSACLHWVIHCRRGTACPEAEPCHQKCACCKQNLAQRISEIQPAKLSPLNVPLKSEALAS